MSFFIRHYPNNYSTCTFLLDLWSARAPHIPGFHTIRPLRLRHSCLPADLPTALTVLNPEGNRSRRNVPPTIGTLHSLKLAPIGPALSFSPQP